jgi:hypothetical protein
MTYLPDRFLINRKLLYGRSDRKIISMRAASGIGYPSSPTPDNSSSLLRMRRQATDSNIRWHRDEANCKSPSGHWEIFLS